MLQFYHRFTHLIVPFFSEIRIRIRTYVRTYVHTFRFSDFRIFGFSDFRIFGFSDFRIFGYLDFWILGILDFWISRFSDFLTLSAILRRILRSNAKMNRVKLLGRLFCFRCSYFELCTTKCHQQRTSKGLRV